MTALRRLRVLNYLSLRDVDVELGPVNVLVGANGAGKSNLLDVIAFLRDAVRTDLRPALDARGGYFRVRYRGEKSGAVEILLEANVTRYSSANAPDNYTLRLNGRRFTDSRQYALWRSETFQFKRTRGRGRRLTIKGSDLQVADDDVLVEEPRPLLQKESLALATLPRLADEAGGAQVRDIARLFGTFRVFDVDVREVRRPITLAEAPPLNDDASNLAAFLMHLAEVHPQLFERVQADAGRIIPGFVGIDFEFVGGGEDEAVVLALKERGLQDTTRISEASYGTVRALALLALLHDPEPPQLTCIEEFDHGLHPYAFDLLVERLREGSARTQYLIATHSPALVNRLGADEIIVCERDVTTGASRIPAIDSEHVRRMERSLEGKMGLGELWFSGALGGVPDA